jgi:hypothetical protein
MGRPSFERLVMSVLDQSLQQAARECAIEIP